MAVGVAGSSTATTAPLRRTLAELFGIDVRSLGVFRVGLAAMLLADLCVRLQDLEAHYTQQGVLPARLYLERWAAFRQLSIHFVSDTLAYQAALFAVAAVAACALLVGYRTRLATVVSWFLLVSLHARNPYVLQGGDVVLRLLLFWSIFLPLGAAWSVDRALDTSPEPRPRRVVGIPAAALLLQVGFVYWFAVALRIDPMWTETRSALYYALSIDELTTPLARYLRGFPSLLPMLTVAVLHGETWGPALAFSPVRTGPLRLLAVAGFVLLHLTFALCFHIGLFSYVMIVAWLPFLPASVWDRLAARTDTPARAGVRIYYDGECTFCAKGVAIIRTFLVLPRATIAPAQDDVAARRTMEREDSWVVVDHDGTHHVGFEAFICVCRRSPLGWWLAPVLAWKPVAWIGGRVYRLVADNRVRVSRWTRWLRYRPLRVRAGWATQALTAILLAYVILWNLLTAYPARFGGVLPPAALRFGFWSHLNQRWSMFALPYRDAGWWVVPGELRDGSVVDLFRNGAPFAWDAAPPAGDWFPNYRWRKYMRNLWDVREADARGHFRPLAEYLCRNWNRRAPPARRVQSFGIYYVVQMNLPDYRRADPLPVLLWPHTCAATAPAETPVGTGPRLSGSMGPARRPPKPVRDSGAVARGSAVKETAMAALSTTDASARKTVPVLDSEMAYVEAGAGDPIVFLHGNPTSSYLWRNVIPHCTGLGRCLAPDLMGMGYSGKTGNGSYRFVDHARYLDGWFDAVGATANVTLVLHDWGSGLGFYWAHRHPDRIKGMAYMEAIVQPVGWENWPEAARGIFEGLRSPAGEAMVLERNLFVEAILPGSILRTLSDDEMAAYRAPFAEAGESRRPTLTWPREIPIDGEPADVTEIVTNYGAWLRQSDVPKLFVNADPGAILTGAQREFCRSWPNQEEITVQGNHFIQEDSADEIGRAVAAFVQRIGA